MGFTAPGELTFFSSRRPIASIFFKTFDPEMYTIFFNVRWQVAREYYLEDPVGFSPLCPAKYLL